MRGCLRYNPQHPVKDKRNITLALIQNITSITPHFPQELIVPSKFSLLAASPKFINEGSPASKPGPFLLPD
jgi:hypothetical protein